MKIITEVINYLNGQKVGQLQDKGLLLLVGLEGEITEMLKSPGEKAKKTAEDQQKELSEAHL